MKMYQCEDCGLLTSEEIFVCPKCNSEKNKLAVNLNNNEGVFYKLTMDDFDMILESRFSEETQSKIRAKFTEEQICDILSRKFSIEWDEEIENAIKAFLLTDKTI